MPDLTTTHLKHLLDDGGPQLAAAKHAEEA